MGKYMYDQNWKDERARLSTMESNWDPGSIAAFEEAGIEAGWKCLEVGGGGGSITEWLAANVGPEGRVVATDVSTRFLEPLAGPSVEVREHDILNDELEENTFDLVHSRLLVEHLGLTALDRMVAAAKPGGWVVCEDYDSESLGSHPEDDQMRAVVDAVYELMSANGFDTVLGRKLRSEFEARGLTDVVVRGRNHVHPGGSPGVDFQRLSLASIAPTLIEQGALTQEAVDRALAYLAEPSVSFISATMYTARGRKPA